MSNIDTARRRAELILPKLEALKRRVGGGKVHDLNGHLALINGNVFLLGSRRLDPEEIAETLITVCNEAEKFMMEVVR